MRNRLLAIGTLTSLLLLSGQATFAQATDTATDTTGDAIVDVPVLPDEEEIMLRTGDTLEIAAETGVKDATYSWIMTQERAFIDAKREKFFRYRFVNDNVYTLRAEAFIPGTGERIQRTFNITVVQPGASQQTPLIAAGTGASIASTIPLPDSNGRVVLKPGNSLVQLLPISTDISPLALDFDASFDSDADGNPGNDVDNVNEDNGFHSFGKPIWIWYARPIEAVDITVTAVPEGQSPQVQRISVLSEDAARKQGVLMSPVNIIASPLEGGNYSFSVTFSNPSVGENPLLYEWNFGDGNLSLETFPMHTYASSGTFEVTLSVRDLQTGNSVGSTTVSVSPVVEEAPSIDEPTEPPVDETTEPPVDEPTEPATEGSGIDWSRIGIIVGLFLGALLLGFALMWLLSFLRKSRKLEETLESMEKAVVPEKEQTPPPLTIKSKQQAAPEKVAQQKIIDAEINASSSPAEPPASVNEAKAPDWLKKGLASDGPKPATSQPKTVPAPTSQSPSVPKPAIATSGPKPVPTPAAPKVTTPPLAPLPPSDTQSKNLPHWLQNPTPAQAAPSSNPVPTTPAPTPAPTGTKPAPSTPPPTPVPNPTPVTPTPKPVTSSPAPTAPTPSVTVTPASAAPKLVPEAPKPFIPTAPSASATPKPMTPTAPAAPAPVPVTPPPVSPIAPARQIQSTPSTQATPPATPTDKKDDDPPIAIIRAENIGPTPTK